MIDIALPEWMPAAICLGMLAAIFGYMAYADFKENGGVATTLVLIVALGSIAFVFLSFLIGSLFTGVPFAEMQIFNVTVEGSP